MFTRGTSQSLQLEGKSTEKTLWTAVTIGATRDVRCSARSVRRCRSKVARLLKTTLQSIVPPPATHARATVAGKHLRTQYSKSTQHGAMPSLIRVNQIHQHFMMVLANIARALGDSNATPFLTIQ